MGGSMKKDIEKMDRTDKKMNRMYKEHSEKKNDKTFKGIRSK